LASLIANRLTIFWWMMAVVAVPVGLLTWRYFTRLAGGYSARPGEPAGVRGLLRAATRRPSGGSHLFLRHLLMDGILHRRLWHLSRSRWLAHHAILLGFVGLAVLSFLAAAAEHALLPLGLRYPAIAALREMDQPFLAALHESLGLLLLLGGLAAGLRRLLRRSPYLPTEEQDAFATGLIFLITISGYPLESLRLLMERVPAELARYSFVGWPLAQLMAPLSLDWATWHFWLFQGHVVASAALFIYWPLGKLMHAFVGPLAAALGASEERPTR